MLTLAPSAFANWSSNLDGVMSGFESRRWDDQQYTEIRFTGCDQGYATSVDVNLWEDVALNYDNYKGDHTFTKCFDNSTSVSAGTFSGLPVNNYYFKIGTIGGSNQLWVRDVDVDTTLADS
ncbi:hypothetical protein [Streptomyces sp. ISL-100]|uniref:hypothetical protein n=1 Tax=Streptomyces sp. ISL-100 TaxID=2819173 RepID=UPI001BE6C0DC|nr:hypothetical protein [Streptomyces sp. ISL-100]MBT2395436.1 hypothetical protein [Streptomyces sp. ISL-100]